MRTIVAVDSGSSTMKALATQGRDSFPSVARKVTAADYPDTLLIQGQRWVVGETALRTYAGNEPLEPQLQRGFHAGDNQHAQICYTLGRLGVEGAYDLLVASLPYEDSRAGDTVTRMKTRTDYTWCDAKGEHSVRFEKVRVLPQGVGALCRYKAGARERPQRMFMVDIGSCTLDEVALQLNPETQDYVYLHDRSMSGRDLNVTTFYHQWLGNIRRLEGLQDAAKGYYELMAMAQATGPGRFHMRWGRDVVDIGGAYEKTRAWFTASIVRRVTHDMGAFERDVERIILTGGGAHLVDLASWDDPRVELLDVWANVEGQFMEALGGAKNAAVAQVDAIQAVRVRA